MRRPANEFFGGVRALFGGIGFIVARPSNWPLALVPVLIATVIFVGAAVLAFYGASAAAASLLGDSASTWAAVGSWALRIFLGLVGVIVAFIVSISLAQPLAGFALEALARRQEVALGGRVWPALPFWSSLARSLRVSLTALGAALVLVGGLSLITLLFPPAAIVTVPLKFVVAGLLVAYDFLDYPLSLRGVGVRARLSFFRANTSAVLGFGLAASAILLVPGAAFFLLPCGAAGASRLLLEVEGAR